MKEQKDFNPIKTSKKVLISLGCLPLILFWVLGIIFPKDFRGGWFTYSFLFLSVVIYLFIFKYISLRGKKYLFNSNQQLWHNYALFMPLYPIFYVWILEREILKNKK